MENIAAQRLMRDLYELRSDPLSYATCDMDGTNYFVWKGTLNGPPGTPYEGGLFEFELQFPPGYPRANPTCKFITPIFHPNVYEPTGGVCLPIFSSTGWNERYTPKTIISYIIALLNDPNPKNGYGGEATSLLKANPARWREVARKHTLDHAMG